MPTVPQTLPSEVLRPVGSRTAGPTFQTTRGATPGAFGANVGSGLQQLGQGVGDVSDVATKNALLDIAEDNEREAKDMDVRFSAAIREIVYGDGTDENPGFYSRQGQGALDSSEDAQKAIDKAREDILSGGSNDRVKSMFGAASAARHSQELDKMSNHVSRQRQVANDDMTQARKAEAADDAAASWNDPEVLGRSLGIVRDEVIGEGERKGWPVEIIANELERSQTIVVQQAVEAALVSDPKMARKIYEDNKVLVDGSVRADIEKKLNVGETRQASQEATDKIMGGNPTDVEALAQARQIKDPEVRDETVDRVNQRLNERDREIRRATKAASSDAFQAVWNGEKISDWAARNPEGFETLASDGTLMSSLQSAENQVSLGQRFARVSDGETLNSLRQMDIADLAEVDVNTVLANLTQAEAEKASRLVAAAKGRMESVASNQGIYNAGESVLNEFAPKNLQTRQRAKSNRRTQQFQRAVSEMNAFIFEFTQQGKLPTRPEMEREAIRLMLEIDADPGIFSLGFEGIAAEARDLSPEQRAVARVDFDDIPPAMLEDLRFSLQERSIPETEDLMEELAGAIATNNRTRVRALLSANQPQQNQ